MRIDVVQPKVNIGAGNASGCFKPFIERRLVGHGCDIGCNQWKVKEDAVGIDTVGADIIADAQTLDGVGDETFDYVYSSHCLEHIDDWQRALANWLRVLKPGGLLVLFLPDVKQEPGWSKDVLIGHHKVDLSLEMILGWCKENGVEAVQYGLYTPFCSFYCVGKKKAPAVTR